VKTFIALLYATLIATSAAAQAGPSGAPDAPALSLRPFAVVSGERFAASTTFKAVFGQSVEPLWGGGLQLALKDGVYVDVTASRFKKTGQRAFVFDGQSFQLGIPVTATLTPIEVTAGYRMRRTSRLIPYIGAGVGSYGYVEKGDAADASEDLTTRHVGYLVVGGVEFRVGRWVALSGDAQYTRVPGILGNGGVSKDAGEGDLGGIAGRFRVIIGR
jgi:outer membrane protein W